MSLRRTCCRYCGYPIPLGAASHADCDAKRIAELEAALRPFAKAAKVFPNARGDVDALNFHRLDHAVTHGDLQRAKAVLEKH